jgi:hypothetical protein
MDSTGMAFVGAIGFRRYMRLMVSLAINGFAERRVIASMPSFFR